MIYETTFIHFEYDPEDNPGTPSPTPSACTVIQTVRGESYCEEDLTQEEINQILEEWENIVIPESTTNPEEEIKEDNSKENPYFVEIVRNEDQEKEYQEFIKILKSIQNEQEKVTKSSDSTVALEMYEEMNSRLDQIEQYIGLFVGLYLIGWIISTFNSWRRSNS